MTTTNRRAQLTRRSLIGFTTINDHVLGWSDARFSRLCRSVYSEDGIFGAAYDVVTGNGVFSLSGSQHCTDGVGNILNPAALATYFSNVPLENTGGVHYDLALKRSMTVGRTLDDSGVVVNPGNGIPEYLCRQETIGEVGDPDAVIDNGGTLTLVIDSVCEANVSHAGRKCLVYLKQPLALVESVAVEECAVAFIGGQNRITTTGTLGQSTVDVDATLYEVCLLGPTIRRNSDLSVEGYVYIGELVGGNPTTFVDHQDVIESDLSQINSDLSEFSGTTTVIAKGGRRSDRPTAVFAPAAAAHGSTIYTFGGADDSSYTTPFAENWAYDTETDIWAAKTAVPYGAFAHIAATPHGDKIYIAGGYEAGGPSVSASARIYDPALDSYSVIADLPAARALGQMASLGGRVYFVGGSDETLTAQTTCWSYNPDTNLWSVIAALPLATARHSIFVHNGKIIVWSGLPTKEVWEYNPDTNVWTDLADGPTESRYGFAFYANGVIHVGLGLVGPGGAVRKHYAYSRIRDEWITVGDVPLPHMYNGCSAVVDGVAYWIGGHAANFVDAAATPWTIACDLRGLSLAETSVSVSHTGRGLSTPQYDVADVAGSMPIKMAKHMACVARRSVWLTGGIDETATGISHMYRYFIDTQVWDRYTDFSETRCAGVFVEHEEMNQIYLIGGHNNGGNNVANGWTFDLDGLVWNPLTTGVFVSQAGCGSRIGNKIWWACGNSGLAVPSEDSNVKIFDCLFGIAGPVKDMGSARKRCISFATLNVGIASTLKDQDYKVWCLIGTNAGNVAQGNMMVYDSNASLYASVPLINIVSSDTQRGATDGRSVIMGSGNRIQTFGETGRNTDLLAGGNSLLHEYDTAMVMFEGQVFQFGGHNNDGVLARERIATNTYIGEWKFYPKNFSRGETAPSIGAARGDIYGFCAWNNRHVYEVAVVGVVGQ